MKKKKIQEVKPCKGNSDLFFEEPFEHYFYAVVQDLLYIGRR
jgi:hypothetical protein